MHNVRMKAQASLIRTFLETAVNSNFQNNLLHTILYRVHVLGEHLLEDPPSLPPYFSVSFFSTIRKVKENTPLNISTMTTAQWYRVLVEDNITMQEKEDKTRDFIPSRAELASTNTDWPNTWRRARLKGLGTQASTFLWKLLHRILPSEDRLSRILPNNTSYCKICPTAVHADLVHCFFQCISTRVVGGLLLSAVKSHDPVATPSRLLRLEFETEDSMEMPLVWLISQTLLYMWGVRADGKIVDQFQTRATLESRIALLRETRFVNETTLVKVLVDQNM